MDMKVSQDWWCQEVLRDVFHGKGWPCNATQWLCTATLACYSGKESVRLRKVGCHTFRALCGNRVVTHIREELKHRTSSLHACILSSIPACEPRTRKRTSGWLRRRAAQRREPGVKRVRTQRTLLFLPLLECHLKGHSATDGHICRIEGIKKTFSILIVSATIAVTVTIAKRV